MRRRVLTVCGSLRPLSANRAAIGVAATYLHSRGDTDIDHYNDLATIPPLNDAPDHEPGQAVRAWRNRIARSDAVLIASPEYAGGVAGTIKNALDWIVGSGELYTKPVAVISAGTSGGSHARQQLIQTLTWQGAHVVAQLGIASPRTKSDMAGRLTDETTIAQIERLSATLVEAPARQADDRLVLVRTIIESAHVDARHIAPFDPGGHADSTGAA
jgi:NAD(P)H-dependent FMN reductase